MKWSFALQLQEAEVIEAEQPVGCLMSLGYFGTIVSNHPVTTEAIRPRDIVLLSHCSLFTFVKDPMDWLFTLELEYVRCFNVFFLLSSVKTVIL